MKILFLLFLVSCGSNIVQLKEKNEALPDSLDPSIKNQFEITDLPKLEPVPRPVIQQKKQLKKIDIPKEQIIIFDEPEIYYYSVGEKFSYTAYALGLKAGIINFEVLPFKFLNNHKAYHFKANITTASFFKSFYYVNDLVESFVDFQNFYSLRYQIKAEEGDIKKHKIELFDSINKKATLWKKITENDIIKEESKTISIEPYSQDILSTFFYIKTLKLDQKNHNINIITGDKNKKIKLIIQERKNINYKDKSYNTYKINMNLDDEKLEQGSNIVFYYSDELQKILLIYIPLKIGSVKIELN